MLESPMFPRSGRLALDGDADRGVFPGRYGGAVWNGWDCPAFPLASVVAMAERFRHDDGGAVIRVTPSEDPALPVVTMLSGPDDCDWPSLERWPDEVQSPVSIDGVPHWTIGAWGWVWSALETCTAPGCDADAWADGECEAHYYADATGGAQ